MIETTVVTVKLFGEVDATFAEAYGKGGPHVGRLASPGRPGMPTIAAPSAASRRRRCRMILKDGKSA
ncbi:MAG: hypothetical protein ACRERE_01715 [Candidatus Entotheonellia bacterium]